MINYSDGKRIIYRVRAAAAAAVRTTALPSTPGAAGLIKYRENVVVNWP